jgi:hypothetical protein
MSSNVMSILNEILLENKVYTIDNLKVKMDIATDELLMELLLCFFADEVDKIDINTNTPDPLLMEKVSNYIKFLIENDYTFDCDYAIQKINDIRNNIDNKFVNIKNSHDNIQNLKIYKEYLKKISSFNTRIAKCFNIHCGYGDMVNKYELLENAVYNIKNLTLIEKLNLQFPDILLSRDKYNKMFFTNLIKNYIDLLNNNDVLVDQLAYYDEVIDLFLKDARSNLNIDNCLRMVLNAIDNQKQNSNLKYPNKSQSLIYLFNLKDKLLGARKYVKSRAELEKKYRLNIVIPNYNNQDIISCFNLDGKKYYDLTDKYVIAIDPPGSTDRDDGFSLERLDNGNYRLGIYIADVSSCVPYNSPDDIEALRRGETIYYNGEAIRSMLSERITIDQCSLLPSDPKKAVICFFEIDQDGDIVNYYFTRGFIKMRNECVISYGDVDNILNREDNSLLWNTLNDLRMLQGKGVFTNIFDERINLSCSTESEIMVSKLMLLVNKTAAKTAEKNCLPFLNRVYKNDDYQTILQNNPDLNKLMDDIFSLKHIPIFKKWVCETFTRSYYTTQKLSHDALGISRYARTSSPIRRYPDLIDQRLIHILVDNEPLNDKVMYQIEDVLNNIATVLNNNQIITKRYIKDYIHTVRRKNEKINT